MSKSNKDSSEVSRLMLEILRKGALEQISQRGLLDYLEIQLFEFHAKQTQEWLTANLKIEQEFIKSQIDSGDPDPNDTGMVAIDYHTKRIYYSNVIHLVSLLETCLQRACDNLKLALGAVPFELSELKGDQWTKRYKFLTRYGHFSFKPELLKQLEILTTVRNYLVHENGNTINIKPEDKKLLIKCADIDIDSYEFKIEFTFIQHGLELLKQLVKELESQMNLVIQRQIESQNEK